MYRALRPLLFALSPTRAHAVAMAGLAPLEHLRALRTLFGTRAPSSSETVHAMGLTFPHAIGLAGGLDKNGHRVRALASLGFGHLEIGTVTAHAQAPNPAPNLFRLPQDQALINRLGFPNDGADAVVTRLARGMVSVPLGLSIGKSRVVDPSDLDAVVADYLRSFAAVRAVADFVVVNVSSPNTKGLRSLQGPAVALALFTALQRANVEGRPLLVKLAPDLDDDAIDALVDAAMASDLAGVVATNTTTRRDGLVTPASDVATLGEGGLSGPPLASRALAVVRRVRKRLGKERTVIGVGGISTPHDALAMREAGANLMQVYTAFIYQGPKLIRDLRCALAPAPAR